jgi:hypothetical protein
MAAPLTGIRACVFDAYGTLFDHASAAAACRDVLGGASGHSHPCGATSSCSTPGCVQPRGGTQTSGR